MFQIPRPLAVAAASISTAASLFASTENAPKDQSALDLGNSGNLEELVLSGKSFNAISQEVVDSAQQSAIKAAQGLKSIISSYNILVERFPEIERPDYKDQTIKLRQEVEKLRELYIAGDWDALQKGSEDTIKSNLKLQKNIDDDLAKGIILKTIVDHATQVSSSFGTKQPAEVKEVLQQALDAYQAFHKGVNKDGSSFDFNLPQLEQRIGDLPSREGQQIGNFFKVAGIVGAGVAAVGTIYYQFPKVIEAVERSKEKEKRKETEFQTVCKDHSEKLDTLKKNLSISETMLQQIGQIRFSENRVNAEELDRLSSRTIALHEMNDAMRDAYDKVLAPVLKIKDREKAEKALRELDEKLSNSNLTSDYRHGTILGVGVQASFNETYNAICLAYKSCTAEFDQIILKLKDAA